MKYFTAITILIIIASCSTLNENNLVSEEESKPLPIRSVFQSAHNRYITGIAVSPDQKLVATSSIDGRVIVYRTSDGVIIHQLGKSHHQVFFSVAFSPSGRYLAAGTYGIIIYDTLTGEEVNRIDNGSYAAGVSFSPDEKYLYYGTSHKYISEKNLKNPDNYGNIYKVHWKNYRPEMREQLEDEGIPSPFYRYIKTGLPIGKFKANQDATLFGVITSNYDFVLYNKNLMKKKLPEIDFQVEDFLFLNDNSLILLSYSGKIYKFINNHLQQLDIGYGKYSGLEINSDESALYFIKNRNKLLKYDLTKNSRPVQIAYVPDKKYLLAYTEIEKKIWIAGGDHDNSSFAILDENGRNITPKYAINYNVEDYIISNNSIGIKPLRNASITLKQLTVHHDQLILPRTTSFFSISNIQRYFRNKHRSSDNKRLWLWNDDEGSEWYCFHPDGETVFLFNPVNKTIVKYNNEDNREILSRDVVDQYWNNGGLSVSGDLLVITNDKDLISILDTNNLSEIRTFKFPRYRVRELTIFNESTVVLATDTGVITFLDIQSGDKVNFIASGKDWIFYTDDGYFAGTRDSGRLLAIVQGTNAYGLDQFAVRFNRPDIIMDRLHIENKELDEYMSSFYEKRLRKLNLTTEDLISDLHVPESEILSLEVNGREAVMEASFTDKLYNLKSYSIYINDVPIFGAEGKSISGKNHRSMDSFILNPGYNKIEISSFNVKGAESYRRLTSAVIDEDVEPTLYFLGFGVSDYLNDDLDLSYAHKDVLDLNEALRNSNLYSNVETMMFTDKEVVPKTILEAKEFLSKTTPEDTVILFLAGHGMYSMEDFPTYYYLTHNTDLDNLNETAISFDEIESLLQGIPARQKLFLLDTCESGELDIDLRQSNLKHADSRGLSSRSIRGLSILTSNGVKIPVTSIIDEEFIEEQLSQREDRSYLFDKNRFIRNDLARRSGAIVFSSCGAGEYSYESPKYENGLFTESILKALNESPSLNVRDLISEVILNTKVLSDDLQNPTVDRDNLFIDFDLK